MTPTVAVVDIGSNSMHLQIEHPDGAATVEREAVQLGRLDQGRFRDDAVTQALGALTRWRDQARAAGAVQLFAAGTAALRLATDRDRLVTAASALGVPVHVLSGQQEAQVIWHGARAGLGFDHALVIDLGGRSTELALGGPDGISWAASVDMGHLSLADSDDPAALARARIAPVVAALAGRPLPMAVATAGTALTLGAMAAHARGTPCADADGTSVTVAELRALWSRMQAQGPDLPGADPRRRASLLPGCVGVTVVAEALGLDTLTLSRSALRAGLVQAARAGGLMQLLEAP